jgi:carbonic anhydrase
LKVTDIIVSGHYGCGGIKAAFTQHDFGPLESWLCHIRDLRSQHKYQLIGSQEDQEKTLVELNVRRQVLNVARIASVQKAWANKRELKIHGVIYDIGTGLLKDIGLSLFSLDHLPSEFRISEDYKGGDH